MQITPVNKAESHPSQSTLTNKVSTHVIICFKTTIFVWYMAALKITQDSPNFVKFLHKKGITLQQIENVFSVGTKKAHLIAFDPTNHITLQQVAIIAGLTNTHLAIIIGLCYDRRVSHSSSWFDGTKDTLDLTYLNPKVENPPSS